MLVAKPLTRVTPLNVTGEGRKFLPVKYEKISYFCQVCGLMGHTHEECRDGVWEPKQRQFGSWMLAQRREMTPAPEPPLGGHATWGSRGRGRGRAGRAGRGEPAQYHQPAPRKGHPKTLIWVQTKKKEILLVVPLSRPSRSISEHLSPWFSTSHGSSIAVSQVAAAATLVAAPSLASCSKNGSCFQHHRLACCTIASPPSLPSTILAG